MSVAKYPFYAYSFDPVYMHNVDAVQICTCVFSHVLTMQDIKCLSVFVLQAK